MSHQTRVRPPQKEQEEENDDRSQSHVMAAKRPTIKTELPGKLNGIPLTYLECRDKLHAWNDYTYTIVRNKVTRRQQIRRVLQCDRCESLRVEMLAIATGDRVGKPVYHHSEGYKLAKGEAMTARDRAAIRLYRAAQAEFQED